MNRMKRLLRRCIVPTLTVGVLLFGLGGCGSTSVPDLRASTPTIYLQSTHAPYSVSRCLERRLPDVRVVQDGESADLLVDGRAWLINVSAAEGGTRVAAHRGDDGERIEPDVRFAIARCTL